MEETSRGKFKVISRYLIGATEKRNYKDINKNTLHCVVRLQNGTSGPHNMTLRFIPCPNIQNDSKTGLDLT